jgi:Skp family chaperone for outer membrane proteins
MRGNQTVPNLGPTIRRSLAVILVAALVAAPTAATAENGTKIGVIDSQRIFSEYQEARDAEAVFQEEMRAWQQEIGELESELMDLQEQIRTQAPLRSKESLDALQSEYEEKLAVYEQRKQEILDPEQGQAVTRNAELSAPINEQITTVVERLGAEGDFDLIIDRAMVNVVYMAEGIDLTDQVLAELEQGSEEE